MFSPPVTMTHDLDSHTITVHTNDCSISCEWLKSKMEGEDSKDSQLQESLIPKVPRTLREVHFNKGCYDPTVVSIGPYHRGKDEFQSMENLKFPMAQQFLQHIGDEVKMQRVKMKVVQDAKKCYDKDSLEALADGDIARMMFLDGCFVIQFVDCIVNKKLGELKMTRQDIVSVIRDLFLLENQVPYSVLEDLMSLRFSDGEARKMFESFVKFNMPDPPPQRYSCKENIENFISYIWPLQEASKHKRERLHDYKPPVHLLELMRRQYVGRNVIKKEDDTSSIEWPSNLSAKELKMSGIQLMPGHTAYLGDMNFKSRLFSGTLVLPPIVIDDSVKSKLLNFVAYEACVEIYPTSSPNVFDDSIVTSYLFFMNSLMKKNKDVKEMISKGILLNFLGNDQKVAELFSEMAYKLVPDSRVYADVRSDIQTHCDKKISEVTKWLCTHISGPWAAIIFSGATITVALAGFQTILGVIQTYYATGSPQ